MAQAWTCPDCGRQFGKANQGHTCSPGLTIDEYFATGPPHERPIFEAVMKHVSKACPDTHVEPVQVGIFFKRGPTYAELRPRDRWVTLSLGLSQKVVHRTIARKVVDYNGRWYHYFNLRAPDDVDDDIRAWLSEAYERAAQPSSRDGKPKSGKRSG
jgi:hypothetical protein